ncbi:MAG: DivIVA domain-containing protein [Acidimicrobiia bacterium]
MINSAGADAHRFGRVRRNGYDPTEVDAVVARLVEELRIYESRTAKLEERLIEADASADAIRRTFVAAEQTRDEIVSGAREQATSITDAAHAEAEDVLSAARSQSADITASAEADAQATAEIASRLEHEVAKRREELLVEAEDQAQTIRSKAESEAADRVASSAAERDALLQDAREAASSSVRSITMQSHVRAIAAAWTYTAANQAASRLLSEARIEADQIVVDAQEDSEEMQLRMAELRAAVAGLEQSARSLAEMTAEEAAVIDLSKIESIEQSKTSHIAEAPPAEDPQPVVEKPAYAMSTVTADSEPLIFEAEDPSEPDRPLLTVAEAHAAIEREQQAPEIVDEEPAQPEPESPTYYQRSTGTPLSERVKIARKSG